MIVEYDVLDVLVGILLVQTTALVTMWIGIAIKLKQLREGK